MMKPSYKIINFILFQVGWLACVLSASAGMSEIGLIYALAFIILHTSLSRRVLTEVVFIVLVTCFGFVIDSWLVFAGYFSYVNSAESMTAPMWIAALWAMFSTTIGYSLNWLSSRYLLAAALGFIFGPLAYYGASKLGAVNLPDGNMGLYFQALIWAVMLPAMFAFYNMLQSTRVLTSAEAR